jgi:hypothetical protein
MQGEIEEANETERARTRIIHHTGSGVFLLILLGALAGLLGEGPLSKSTARAPDKSVHADYARFLRYQNPAELNLTVGGDATENGTIELRLSNTFIKDTEIRRLDPEPEIVVAGSEFHTYRFQVEPRAAIRIKVCFAPRSFGRLVCRVGLSDHPTFELRQFVFP